MCLLPLVSAGLSVSFTVTVSPSTGAGTPTGTVTFDDGSNVLGTGILSGGKYTFSFSFSNTGSPHTLTALYSGDTYFNSGLSSPFVLNVS